ncbi:MAG: hypothetical protein R2690_12550 [Acidimicrobiales bacterium]
MRPGTLLVWESSTSRRRNEARAERIDGGLGLGSASSRWCPNCDGQYVATAEMCADCEVPLVDERTPIRS